VSEEAEAKAYFARRQRTFRRWAIVGSVLTVIGVLAAIAIWIYVNTLPVNDKRAIEAVEAAGFTDVVLGGRDLLACDDDEFTRHFAATNPQGKRVEGAVCCGLKSIGKACTLRFAH
jgi:hypothetical protein